MSHLLSSKLESWFDKRLAQYVPVELKSKGFDSLAHQDKQALKFLFKAGRIMDDLYLVQVFIALLDH